METTRRRIVASLGSFSVLALLGAGAPTLALPRSNGAYGFFSFREAELIHALLGRLIPEDGEGPGALSAGVDTFLDRALAGSYGAGTGQYLGGRPGPGTPQQGYQLVLDPAQFYRLALADTDKWAKATHGRGFAELTADLQVSALMRMTNGSAQFELIPSSLWFETLWFDVQCGYFSDPIYGGNRGMAGWSHVGFPGAAYRFREYLGTRTPVRLSPVGLTQLSAGGR